jgi:hypothetical protein
VREAYSNKVCHICGEDLICPKCGTPSPTGTNFSNWIRAQPINHFITDIDFLVHDFRKNTIMTLEEKCKGAMPSKTQVDTHYVLYQMLKNSNGMEVKTLRGVRPVHYRGHHVISFENTSPEDSEWLSIDGSRYTIKDLYNLIDKGKL